MRHFRRSERGLSEIVGTLILILIVVSAATLLAAFVASYQKQLQTEESFTHDQSLESIHILGLTTAVSGGNYTKFGFTLASKYVNPSIILDISINSEPLKHFNWTDLSTSQSGRFTLGQDLNLSPFEEVSITLNLDPPNDTYSFLNNTSLPQPDQYLTFNVYTVLQNDFTQVFLPPTPLAVVSEIDPSGNNPITLLDGSMSFQPGTNTSLVSWGWTVSGGGLVSTGTNLSGAMFTDNGVATANGALATGVINATGANATFTVPTGFTFGVGDSVAFTLGSNLSVTGTSTTKCTLSNSAITSGAKGSVNGTTLTVTFPFTTLISGGCTVATLGLGSSGVSLHTAPVPLTASGEEYEISPALPPLLSGQLPYSVTLIVANSVGLEGAVTVSYTPTP